EFNTSWDIKATPTFIFLRDGQQADKIVWANEEELINKIEVDVLIRKTFQVPHQRHQKNPTHSQYDLQEEHQEVPLEAIGSGKPSSFQSCANIEKQPFSNVGDDFVYRRWNFNSSPLLMNFPSDL
ncbi:Thioredoxin-like fold, partial [Cynara cardunculus var. scolymus]